VGRGDGLSRRVAGGGTMIYDDSSSPSKFSLKSPMDWRYELDYQTKDGIRGSSLGSTISEPGR
jgi:hypothetical protein